MECYAEKSGFITLKEHKENFRSSQKCRAINPSKGQMVIVSK